MAERLTIVAAVNDEQVLEQNLLRSSVIAVGRADLIVERGHRSAGAAYNAGLAKTKAAYVAFIHQDVYLPEGWDERLMAAIDYLNGADPKWGVLGPFGVTEEGKCAGLSWSTGIGAVVGVRSERPTAVVSFDELALVLRRDAGLTFDADLPAYHLYGTDIVQIALSAGRTAYVFDGPVIHNSLPVVRLDSQYGRAYRYMQRKWRARLPLLTPVGPVTRWGWALRKNWVRATVNMYLKPAKKRERVETPDVLARQLGFAR